MPDTLAPAAPRPPLGQHASDPTSATLTLPRAAHAADQRRAESPVDPPRPLVVLAVVVYVVFLILGMLPIPQPIKTIICLVLGLIFLLVLLGHLGFAL